MYILREVFDLSVTYCYIVEWVTMIAFLEWKKKTAVAVRIAALQAEI
jgi:hypothetical protein